MMSLPMNLAKSCIRFLAGSDLAPSAPALLGGGFWLSALSPLWLGAFCFPASTRTGVSSGHRSGRLVPDSPVGTAAAAGLTRKATRRCDFCSSSGLTRAQTRVFSENFWIFSQIFPSSGLFYPNVPEKSRFFVFFWGLLWFWARESRLSFCPCGTLARACVRTCVGASGRAWGRVRACDGLAGRKKSFR